MKTCKVYLGLDDKLIIRGLKSEYFTIYFASLIGFLLLAAMSVLSIVKNGNISPFVEILLETAVLLMIYAYFHKKSKRPKMPKKTNVLTISNRGIYRTLFK